MGVGGCGLLISWGGVLIFTQAKLCLFRLDHGRPNIRQEFALKLRRTPKPSNASSLDSITPYENLAQLETFIH